MDSTTNMHFRKQTKGVYVDCVIISRICVCYLCAIYPSTFYFFFLPFVAKSVSLPILKQGNKN